MKIKKKKKPALILPSKNENSSKFIRKSLQFSGY